MNYAFLDIAHQFQFETLNSFLKTTKSSLVYLNTISFGQFHGDNNISQKYLNSFKEEFPSLIHTKTNDFLYPENFAKYINVECSITESELIEFKSIESMAMRLMDRSSLIPISSFSRRRIYLILLNYFDFIIKSTEISDLIVFDTPHSFHSHIFYELAKKKGVRIIKMEYHFLNDYSIVLNQDSWPVIPKSYLIDKSLQEIEKNIPKNLLDSIYLNSKYLDKYKASETRSIAKQNVFSSIKLYWRYVNKALKNFIMGLFPFLFKKEILHFASLNNIKNRLKYRVLLNLQLWKLIKLNIHYNKIANKEISLDENYVFVGLHMQPEKTSQPMGGEFDNQLMMIKILSDSVPEGWKVYVKEHPNQFNVKKVPNRHYRDKLFYSCLEELKNVELVPLEIDSQDLIVNAKMVATLTGTLGWEAITKNIPALVFGNTYYMACNASRKVTSVESCKNSITELSALNDADFKIEIIRYVSYYYENNFLVQSANWQSLFEFNSLAYGTQLNNIVEKLEYFHNINKSQ